MTTSSFFQITLLYMVVVLSSAVTFEEDIEVLLHDNNNANGNDRDAVEIRRTSNCKPSVAISKSNGSCQLTTTTTTATTATGRNSSLYNATNIDGHRGQNNDSSQSLLPISQPHTEAQAQENWLTAAASAGAGENLPLNKRYAPATASALSQNYSSIDTFAPPSSCGGILKSRHGIIQTPHFPKQFPIPIECVWVIDTSEVALDAAANISIVVYLTQLYALSGLKFTEYMYYSDDYKVPSDRIFQLTEDDVTQVAWIQFQSQYLEIKFQMNTLYGTHLRALDSLLDVYGFNITYEVDAVKSYQCNTLQCRFLGHCYAKQDYTGYYCSCFPGYNGTDCGRGPLCEDPHTNYCQNGGTCKHMGDAAIICYCRTGFKGYKCEIPEISEMTMGCTENNTSSDCGTECDFSNTNRIILSSKNKKHFGGYHGKTRFEVILRLGRNSTDFYHRTTESERKTSDHLPSLLERHLSRVLRNFNITRINDLELISNSSDRLDVKFHFFGMKNDSIMIRDAIMRLVERGRIGNITLVSKIHHFNEIPPLKLLDTQINQNSAVREDGEFIVSCIAQGSSKMQFQWYKDGAIVNASKATREIWTTVLPPKGENIFTAILGVTKANRIDEGIYTCKVVDAGVEQCRSLYLQIKSPPRLRVDPTSVTLHRGDSLRVRCLSPGNDIKRYKKLGYSWTRNGVLFQSNPTTAMWEDLYPDGSILKINNVQKSVEYSCIVSNNVKPVSKSVYVSIVDRNSVQLCHTEKNFGIRWPTSAPGAAVIADCPKRYVGFSRRICEKRDIGNSSWLKPDFSHCIADQILEIYNKFRSLTSGYQVINCSAILKSSLDYATRRNIKFLPGEAGFLIDLLQEIDSYLKIKGSQLEREMGAEIILHILDRIMQNVHSMNSQQQIKKFQLLTQSAALSRETIFASQLKTATSSDVLVSSSIAAAETPTSAISLSSFSSHPAGNKQTSKLDMAEADTDTIVTNKDTITMDRLNSLRIYMTAVKALPFNLRIYGNDLFSDQLYMDIFPSNRLHTVMANSTIFASVISYKYLKNFLPKIVYSKQSDTNANDIDYVLASRIIQTWLFQSNRSNDSLLEPLDVPYEVGHVEILFKHDSGMKNSDWIPVCGHDYSGTFESTLDTDSCVTKSMMENVTRCICPLSGSFVVMLTKRNNNTTITRPSVHSIFVVIGCIACLLQSCTALVILLPIWYNRRSEITFLKMQFCVSTSAVMAINVCGFLKILPQNCLAVMSSILASLMLLGLSTLTTISLVVHSELMPNRLLNAAKQFRKEEHEVGAGTAALDMTTEPPDTSTTTMIITNKQQQRQLNEQKQLQQISCSTGTTIGGVKREEIEIVDKLYRQTHYHVSSGIRGAICISWLLPILFAICAPLIYSIIGKWPQHWWIEVMVANGDGNNEANITIRKSLSTTPIKDNMTDTHRQSQTLLSSLLPSPSSSSSSQTATSTISSSFIIFIFVEVLFIILFVLLLIILSKQLLWLLRKHSHRHCNKYDSSIWKRIGLLYRTGIIFLCKLTTDALFITYANSMLTTNGNRIWGHTFGMFSILLGFSILLCFVIKAEQNLDTSKEVNGSLKKTGLSDKYCSGNCINSPLNFYTNHEQISESDASLTTVGEHAHLQVTILPAVPRNQMITGMQTKKSVGSFFGSANVAFVGNVDGKKTPNSISKEYIISSMYEKKQSAIRQSAASKGRTSPLSRCCSLSILGGSTTISDNLMDENLKITHENCAVSGENISRRMATSWQFSQHNEVIADSQNYYDAYASYSGSLSRQHYQHRRNNPAMAVDSQIAKPAPISQNAHEFMGVETLDILKGVSSDGVIRTHISNSMQSATKDSVNSDNLNYPNNNHSLHCCNTTQQQHHKPFVENVTEQQTISTCDTTSTTDASAHNINNNNKNTTSSVTTQTPRSQKRRITIADSPQKAHTFDPVLPVISMSSSKVQSIHQFSPPTPIIIITCSSIDEAASNHDCTDGNEAINCNNNSDAVTLMQSAANEPILEQKNESSIDTEKENSITGMFDRISHDLDYLLNRTNTVECGLLVQSSDGIPFNSQVPSVNDSTGSILTSLINPPILSRVRTVIDSEQ